MTMGLVAQNPTELIELDERYVPDMALRRNLLESQHADVFAVHPGCEAERTEALGVIADLLPSRFPHWFERQGDTLHNRLTAEAHNVTSPTFDPLELAGRLVQEDLCLVRQSAEGPVLVAAVLCFPTRWRLHEKIGRPLQTVHANVPAYAESLGKPVDRLMSHLRAGKLVQRLNWSVIDDPALFQPGGKWRRGVDPHITPENAGDSLVLRVERQTLSRLQRTGSILFTIRVHVYPLSRIAERPIVAAQLAASIRALPPELQHYKSLIPFRAAVLAYLDGKA